MRGMAGRQRRGKRRPTDPVDRSSHRAVRSRPARSRRAAPRRLGGTLALLVMLSAAQASSQLALPVTAPSAQLASLASQLVYTIDLGTLPTRPVLVVEVTPDAAHPDMQLVIDINNFVGDFSGPGGGCAIPVDEMSWTRLKHLCRAE